MNGGDSVDSDLRGAMVDNLPVVVALIDGRKRFTYVNRHGRSWLGDEPFRGAESEASAALDSIAWALLEPLIDQALAGEVSHAETPFPHRTLGVERWLAIQCHPQVSDGRVVAVYLIAVDVHSLKVAEREAAENAAQVEAVIEAAIDGIITIDRHGSVERVNSAALQMLGYRRDEMLGRNLNMIMPEPYRSGHDGYLRRYAETGERRIIGIVRDLSVVRKDGATVDIELSVSQVAREPEHYFLGIIRDVSERIAATRALSESEERLALAIDGANDGLWDWNDTARDTVWWSPRFYQLLGYANGEISASSSEFIRRVHPDDQASIREVFQRQDHETDPIDVVCRVRRKEGDYHWFRVRARVYRNEETPVVRMAGTLQDIHGQKLAETARDSYEARLRRTVEELDRFAYIASHDLKAPLRAIENLAKWIVEDAGNQLPEQPRAYLEKMQGRIARMDRLLDDLLQYSRAGRKKGELEVIDLDDFVTELVDVCNVPEGFNVRIDGPLPRVRTFATPLRHVIQNLVSNAIKHHDQATGQVDLSGSVSGGMVEILVRDDGPGIPEEFHAKVFELFQTLRPRDEFESSGLGLAIVKKLVEAEGGAIRIDPGGGRGTVFRLWWPAEACEKESP